MTRKPGGGWPELQFGHGGDAVESGRAWPVPSARNPRFNSATAVMPWRERPCASQLLKARQWLQFGHGGDAVERLVNLAAEPVKNACFNSATAVMPWRGDSKCATSRFVVCLNAATGWMPWRGHSLDS